MHKSRLEAPGSAMWSTQVANWLQTLQTDVTRLWRRVPQVPDPALGIVPEYRPDGTGGGDSSPQVVRFRNDDTTDAPAFGVMQITGAVIDATSGERVVTVIQPNKFGCQYDVLVNGAEPVTPGELGNAQLLGGPVAALYNVGDGTPAQGEIWGPRAGDWLLRKDTGGFEICGNPSGGSVMVNHAPWLTFVGVAVTAFAANASGTVRIYMGANGSETDTGVTMSVWNRYAAIQAEKRLDCLWFGRGFQVNSVEC